MTTCISWFLALSSIFKSKDVLFPISTSTFLFPPLTLLPLSFHCKNPYAYVRATWIILSLLFYHSSFCKALSFNAVYLTNAILLLMTLFPQCTRCPLSLGLMYGSLSSWLLLLLSSLYKGEGRSMKLVSHRVSYSEIVFSTVGWCFIFHALPAGSTTYWRVVCLWPLLMSGS